MTYRSGSLAFTLFVSLSVGSVASRSAAVEILHYAFEQVDQIVAEGPFTTPDSSGRNNTATLTAMDNTNLTPGRVGSALRFEGGTSTATRDRVEVLTTDVATLTDLNRGYSQFTFAAFVKPIGIAAEEPFTTFIAGKIGTGNNRGWQVGLVGADPVHPDEFVVSLFDGQASDSTTNEFYSGPTTALADNKWIHIAFTFSGTEEASSFFRMYINGEKIVDEATTLFQMNGVNPRAFQVGNRGDSRANSWSGLIDEVHLYDNALTDEEILDLIPPLPVLAGDYDDDNDVDGDDFLFWQQTLGSTVTPGTSADGDVSGKVDAGDLEVWKTDFGSTVGSTPIASQIPEPSTLTLLAAACVGVRRRRQ